MNALALASILVLLAGAAAAARAKSRESARRRAVGASLVALVFGVLAASTVSAAGAPGRFVGLDGLSAPFLPFTSALVLVLVLGAPSAALSPEWAGRVLTTSAALAAFFCVRDRWLLYVLWVGSTVPTYLELRANGRAARVFGAHRLASALLVGVGTALAQANA
ncbi:MAG: hypothetical protein H5U40_07645, partial [Polyangiaceae bacterium]|nr:hypothetical protein [Polyangiaceae bacterium]